MFCFLASADCPESNGRWWLLNEMSTWVGWGRGSSDVKCPALLEVGVVTMLYKYVMGGFTGSVSPVRSAPGQPLCSGQGSSCSRIPGALSNQTELNEMEYLPQH